MFLQPRMRKFENLNLDEDSLQILKIDSSGLQIKCFVTSIQIYNFNLDVNK